MLILMTPSFADGVIVREEGIMILQHAVLQGIQTGLLLGPKGPLIFASVVVAAGPRSARNIELISHLDVEGGGMVDVVGNLAAVGNMGPPYATTLLDVADPARPRVIAKISARDGTHSHKARICGNSLVINVERYGGGGDGSAGLALYDVRDPKNPKETAYYRMGGLATGGTGVHRFQMDCDRKLVYASGSADGF
jgi:hypothetical protein